MASSLFFVRPTLGQGGADRVTLTLLRELDRTRFISTLVLMRPEGAFLEDVPGDVRLLTLGGGTLWQAWWPLLHMLRREKPDILFSTSSGMNVIASIAHALSRSRSRLVLSERGLAMRDERTLKRRALFQAKRLLYRRADSIAAVSNGVRDFLVQRLGIPADLIDVVYNPIVDEALAAAALEPLTHPWFGDDVPLILAAGRLVSEKDFQTLIDAFAIVRHRQPARLLILGEGPLRNELQSHIDRLGLTTDVQLPGFDKNPFKYMARCTMFVLSSRFEGLPGVLIQAMACGAPVIATDCPSGPSEIITDGIDGFLVPVGDATALAARINELLDQPERRAALGQKAREAAHRFSVDVVLERYEAAIAGPGAPVPTTHLQE